MENLTFDPNLCYARKNQKNGFHIQCPFNKKIGHFNELGYYKMSREIYNFIYEK